MNKKSDFKKLDEVIKRYKELKAQQEQMLEQMNLTLHNLERSRQDAFEHVASDNSNESAQNILSETEAKVAKLQSEILEYQGNIRKKLQAEREEILHKQEESLTALEEKNRNANITLLQIRKMDIPKAEENLTMLNDKAQGIDESIKTILAEIESINHLKMDDVFLS